jgi:DNA-binding CsgD family transcriptional regulator
MRPSRSDSALPVHDAPTDEILHLLERLLKQVEERDNSESTKGEQVLLDVCLHGFRYKLLRQRSVTNSRILNLSPREIEIARMIAEGHSNKIIAAVLDISSWTVCTHLRRLFAKLNVSSRAAMVARVLEAGLMADAAHDRAAGIRRLAPFAQSAPAKCEWKDVHDTWCDGDGDDDQEND